MARQARIEYPGAIHHVMSRGDRREDIYLDDVDRQDFLKTLAEACQKTGWQVQAYCLMSNHFHLVVETPEANLGEGMHWFLSTYTIRLNKRQALSGHVFSGRFKSLIVEGSGNGYLRTACDYVHLNPVRAGLLGPEEALVAYPWSSLIWYAAAPQHRPSWMQVNRLLGQHGIHQDSAEGRALFLSYMERRRLEARDEETLRDFEAGWCLGSQEFRQKMLELVGGKSSESLSGTLRRESAEAKAARIIAEELNRLGWTEADLIARRKTDPGKLALAARLRKETTLTVKRIAALAHLGTSKSANVRLHAWMHGEAMSSSANQPRLNL